MTTETMLTGGQPDTATASPQSAPDASGQQAAAPDTQQQQQHGTEAPAGDKPAGDPVEGDKPEGDKPDGEQDDADDNKEAKTGAPEEYEDFAAPEGVTLDAEVTTEFKGLAKELGLPQDKAQQVADLGVKLAQKWQTQQAEALSTAVAKWAEDTTADKELGGDQLKENLAVAKKALDTFGTPELKTLLIESGLGNHPEIIRAFYRAGKAVSEDTFVGGKRQADAKSDAKSFYPNSNMN